jgi:hypothetical protein
MKLTLLGMIATVAAVISILMVVMHFGILHPLEIEKLKAR